jgi:hypothetical protein
MIAMGCFPSDGTGMATPLIGRFTSADLRKD